MLTICYVTSRKEPRFNWFLDSISSQIKGGDNISLVVVARWAGDMEWRMAQAKIYNDLNPNPFGNLFIEPVKPNVWQGPSRLTGDEWFCASNARNTGLCLAPDGWIAYVDDLSVVMPGWLDCVREAMAKRYIVFGAYKKVKELQVEHGVPVHFIESPHGLDSRWPSGSDTKSVTAAGSWLYGCSCAFPVEWLLAIGGWPEMVDGLGFEDCLTGVALENHGFPMRYERRMLTLESEEEHYKEPSLRREDPGVSPNDKSHAALKLVKDGRMKYFPNYVEGGIPALRKKILAGEPFPPCGIPEHDWWDGRALKDL